jgi:hypothetical protein
MDITKVLAVYRLSPLWLVVEAADGTVGELSLKELQDGGHRLSRVAWKDLLEDYQLFTCRPRPREGSRLTPRTRPPVTSDEAP